ncbi:MAG: hypothetical protein IH991_24445, partial [Planctomycetes bacterium]|nr:hypothetical protein [Planctomycetota bacterium]
MNLRFEGDIGFWFGVVLAILLAVAIVWLYRHEVKQRGPAGWLLPVLRAAAVVLIIFMLTGPVLRGQKEVGDRSRVLVFVDESKSMSLTDEAMSRERKLRNAVSLGLLEADETDDEQETGDDSAEQEESLEQFDQLSRWQRAELALVFGDSPLVATLADKHHVELLTTTGPTEGDSDPRRLWWPHDNADLPERLQPESPTGPKTDLVAGIKKLVGRHNSDQRLAVVLWSDGQHNENATQGASPLHLAKVLGSRGVPIFTVGAGALSPPQDLAVLAVQGPQSVFVEDRVKGEILIKDNMPAGKPMVVKIQLDGELVWQEHLTTTGEQRRTVQFDFPIKTLVEDRLARSARNVGVVSLPLPMEVIIEPVEGELRDDNNQSRMHIRAVTRPRRILLID